jgi:hypothetical protein
LEQEPRRNCQNKIDFNITRARHTRSLPLPVLNLLTHAIGQLIWGLHIFAPLALKIRVFSEGDQ